MGDAPKLRTRRNAAASRRLLLGQIASSILLAPLVGCGTTVVKAPAPPPMPDVKVAQLTDILTSAGLRWLVEISPRTWFEDERLRPALNIILQNKRLDALELNTGVNLRQVPALALAGYKPSTPVNSEPPAEDTIAYALRHGGDASLLEQRFRKRLTAKAQRRVQGHQLTMVDGRVGAAKRALSLVGPDVCVYQFGGTATRGPARIALLYAQNRLKQIPSVGGSNDLSPARHAVDGAPLQAILPGPFEGEMARGARGLFASATSIACSLTPVTPPLVKLQVFLFGDYQAAPERAAVLLQAAWTDLAQSDLGHLLGFGQPAQPERFEQHPDRLSLEALLDLDVLLKGLAAVTVQDVRDIMR